MKDNIKLFEDKKIRSERNEAEEEWYLAVSTMEPLGVTISIIISM